MKRKRFLRTAIFLLALSIAAFFYCLQQIGAFNRNQVLVQAIACKNCAAYEVITGNTRIAGQIQEPADSVNIYQVYLTGLPNPFASDYTKTYDCYVVSGKVTGLQKAPLGGMLFPVITVTAWKSFNVFLEWALCALGIIFLIVSIRLFRKFWKANRRDITEAVLLTHSNPPVKKA